jgi:hypothetical protein
MVKKKYLLNTADHGCVKDGEGKLRIETRGGK